jgi:hypothetical protein
MRNGFAMQKMDVHHLQCACGVICNVCTLHEVPLTPHAKFDTTCTMDERFVRPWRPLKGISIKNFYGRKLSYPNTIKLYKFKEAI